MVSSTLVSRRAAPSSLAYRGADLIVLRNHPSSAADAGVAAGRLGHGTMIGLISPLFTSARCTSSDSHERVLPGFWTRFAGAMCRDVGVAVKENNRRVAVFELAK